MHDSDIEVCKRAAYALAEIGDAATVQGLCGLLNDSDPMAHFCAICALVVINAIEAVAPLVTTLDDPDPEVREFAVCCLGLFEEKAALQGLVKAVSDSDVYVRRAAVLCLRESDDLIATRGLCDVMRDPDEFIRYHAVREVALRLPPDAVTLLLVTLRDSDYTIRNCSARMLGVIGDAAAVEQMLAAVQCEEVAEVRRTICWALGAITVATAKAAQSAAETAKAVQETVLPTLNRVGVKDPSKIVRIQAIQVLVGLGAAYSAEAEDDNDNPSEPLLPSKEMLMEANEAIEELHTFCHVRNILKVSGKDTFVISWMREQLCANYKVIGTSTLRNHLYAVRELFEPHFHPAEDGRNQEVSHLPSDNMRKACKSLKTP